MISSSSPRPRTSSCSLQQRSVWWPGIRLVHRDAEQLERGDRQVDVDGDPAPEVAEVLAERQPGLAAHQLQDDSFACRELDQVGGLRARFLDHSSDHGLDVRGGTRKEPPTAGSARPASRLPGAARSSCSWARREERFVGERRSHAVAPFDLVGVRRGTRRPTHRRRCGARRPDRAASRQRPRRAARLRRPTSRCGSTGAAASTAAASSGGPK